MITVMQDKFFKKTGHILEYEPISESIPAFFHNDKDAGYDLYTAESKWVWPFKVVKIPVSIKVCLPDDTFGFITCRSSMYEKGINVINGIVDESYRGIPHVAVHKIGIFPKKIKAGTRIAQMIIIPYIEPMIVKSVIKEDTNRGANGFGSTDKSI